MNAISPPCALKGNDVSPHYIERIPIPPALSPCTYTKFVSFHSGESGVLIRLLTYRAGKPIDFDFNKAFTVVYFNDDYRERSLKMT